MESEANPRLQEFQQFMADAIPYWKTLGLRLVEVAPGHAVFEADVSPGMMQNGVVHGGVLASIADSACAVAGISHVFPKSYATTVNLQVAYLKPLREGRFRAEGKCVKPGRSVLFCEARVVDQQGTPICTASSQLLVVSR
ncbi:MAG TPA: PaaI family thioesterase [Candidatus Limnocylindrales bacterium]|nr:PaaI family thioesterase [Candidatus Limnocylindrales bacterium]